MSSSSHTNPFSHRAGARIPSNSSLGPSWHDHSRWSNDPADMEQLFTSDMRDRQARGKDPYSDELSETSSGVKGMGMGMRMTGGGAVAPSR